MRVSGFCVAVAAALFASQADAAVVVSYGGTASPSDGIFSSIAGTQTIDFDSVTALTGITYASSKGSLSLVSGDVGGVYKAPNADTSKYLTIGSYGGETVTISLASANTYFGLDWGTPDGYNSITFFDGATQLASYSGNFAEAFVNFSFTAGDTYNRIELFSQQAAFETDNHAFAASPVPVPAAVPLFLSGLGAIGWLARQRRG